MKICEGAYYRTRGGQVFGPMVRDENPDTTYPWRICFTEHENCWTEAGRWSVNNREYPFDLVAEVYVSDLPPCEGVNLPAIDGPNGPFRFVEEAKTLRDEFAMEAMSGLVRQYDSSYTIACIAYEHADAMMEARKK